jgi:hypothetical protein
MSCRADDDEDDDDYDDLFICSLFSQAVINSDNIGRIIGPY